MSAQNLWHGCIARYAEFALSFASFQPSSINSLDFLRGILVVFYLMDIWLLRLLQVTGVSEGFIMMASFLNDCQRGFEMVFLFKPGILCHIDSPIYLDIRPGLEVAAFNLHVTNLLENCPARKFQDCSWRYFQQKFGATLLLLWESTYRLNKVLSLLGCLNFQVLA